MFAGKGLSGGRVVVYPARQSSFKAADSILVGNVALYGATSGSAFFAGMAAERFCVRNSGATAVVEGVGDHGCEYMTGGVVLVMGKTGKNFAAGMSGGIAFVYDPNKDFPRRCNMQEVDLESVAMGSEDDALLRSLITQHRQFSHSELAQQLLQNWQGTIGAMVKVYPRDFRRAIQQRAEKAAAEKAELDRLNKTDAFAELKRVASGAAAAAAFGPVAPDLNEREKALAIGAAADAKKAERPSRDDKAVKVTGFMKYNREALGYRDPAERLKDWNEVHAQPKAEDAVLLKTQSARCMDCGTHSPNPCFSPFLLLEAL